MSGRVLGEDLRIHLFPAASPDRVATVLVLASAEIFDFGFAGHSSVDFAYDDADRPETLQERIDLAAAATMGPTRVILERAGEVTVGSTLVENPTGRTHARIRWSVGPFGVLRPV